ncbi:hypothetical protein [Streptosporangium roseum]|uniref:hypothetical protein n=1 Tax=Streptosporangium roseum TaxID=2001 RepID=UPI00332036B4
MPIRSHAPHDSLPPTRGSRAIGTKTGAKPLGTFKTDRAEVGGPAVSLYAVNAGWTVREFVPNAQFYGVVVNAFSVTAKGLPQLTAPIWLLVAAGIAAGSVIGEVLAQRVPEGPARLTVLLLALTGGLTTLGKGLWSL